jgi:hypothetical protein
MAYKDKEQQKRYMDDHNHTTRKVKQLLCQKCNQAIGLFGENISTILKAVDYLNKWK